MRSGRSILVALAIALLPGCGRKAVPLPPIIEVPETTSDLWPYQDGKEVVLNWSYPQLTRVGRSLTDLARIEVWRLEVPPGQEQVGAGTVGEDLRRQLMLGRGKLVARLEGESLQAATRGKSLTYREPLPQFPAGTSPPSLWYAVRSRRKDGTASALSNIITWQPRPVPPVPAGFSGKPDASGVVLSWEEVPGFTYVVERRLSKAAAWEVVSPVGIKETTFKDTSARQGETWTYRVRSFLQTAASPPSAELEVPFPDVYPPPPATALICLPEPGMTRLRWEASPETGVTYRVFRRQGGGDWTILAAAVGVSEFVDPAPPLGEVQYSVRTMDAAGNLSDAVACTVRTGS